MNETKQVFIKIQCDKDKIEKTFTDLLQVVKGNKQFKELETAYYMAEMTEEE